MYWFFSRSGRRRISRSSSGSVVASSAQSRVAGAFRPVPAGPLFEHRLANRPVSACDLVLRDGDHGSRRERWRRRTGRAPAARPGSSPDRPYTSSAAAHSTRSPPAIRRFTCSRASSGLVANARPSGIPAFCLTLRVPGPAVRHVHVEIDPRLPARGDQRGEHPGHAVLDPAGHPGVLRRHARGRLPLDAGERSRRARARGRSRRAGHRAVPAARAAAVPPGPVPIAISAC